MKTKVTQDDVWGKWAEDHSTLISRGMIVAQGYGGEPDGLEAWKKKVQVSNLCPVWNEILPYKSVTVICKLEEFNDVTYWLSYVHGGEYSKTRDLGDGRIAIRSDYQCW